MPLISTNMHFGKLFIENLNIEINIPSFIIGMVSPDTINEEEFENLHTFDDDGNIDVHEFYEQFTFSNLNLIQKSFVLGYYCHLWFYEYYKFNASKLTIHNTVDLTDEELGVAVKNLLNYYGKKATGDFFEKYINDIKDFDNKDIIKLNEISGISIKNSKERILDFLESIAPNVIYPQLIEEQKYVKFIKKGCDKIMKSL